ncbi:nuclear transport factor 2 family protein [Streptomyces avermitilis]|uniref:nuclear transport factor 2 family protein n=1 Tax=Streptomyces avermitilis TaxID=33903 RepID=UPI00382462F9
MSTPEQNKELVLTAFDTLFGKRDYAAAEEFWSANYLQHSRHIPPGREGLFNLVRALPAALRYDNQLAVAEGDYVMLYGRYSGTGETAPSWPTWCVSRTADWPNTGTPGRTRRPAPSPQATSRCSATTSRTTGRGEPR